MDDTEPAAVSYYRWDPPHLPDGMYTIPLLGELRPGRVTAIPQTLSYLAAGDAWVESSKDEYDAQPPIWAERDEVHVPADDAPAEDEAPPAPVTEPTPAPAPAPVPPAPAPTPPPAPTIPATAPKDNPPEGT
jgi:hypothetical protein